MQQQYFIRKDGAVDHLKWNELIACSTFSTPFQTKTYYDFCNTTSGIKAEVFAIENNKGDYEALCLATIQKERGLKSYFSGRAIIYGGPVLSEDCNEEALSFLLETIQKELKNKVIYIEIRNFKNYQKYSTIFKKHEWSYIPYLNVKVDLFNKSLDTLLSSFNYNRRREIKMTLKAGISYCEAVLESEIKTIYTILKELYKKRIGLPIPSLDYFINFWKSGLMKVFAVKDGERIVGGAFCVVLKNEAIFTFYYCGVRDYKPKTYPTHLAVLAAVDYGIKHGLKYLDFMGAGQPEIEYGVRKYKMEFGGELVEEGRYLLVTKKLLYRLGASLIGFLKRRRMNSTR